MSLLWTVVLSALLIAVKCDLSFPPDFKFGAASSSYQVEGAWNVSDKSESVWDHFTHERPDLIDSGSSGDISGDSYHNWRRDVEIAVELGLQFYRFSISWTRLLPSGFTNHISEDGKRYYSNLIDELLKNNIEPLVTLYHFDLPQKLQDLGGWSNPLASGWFENYSRVVYSLFADRVKTWITINEPVMVCDLPYSTGVYAPGILSPDFGVYLCNKHILIAHAKAWRVYDKEYKPKYHGRVSIANHFMWFEPMSEKDKELTSLVEEYYNGRYAHPIYSKEGGWPPAIERTLADISKKEGYLHSKLPAFTKEEIELMKGTYDYFALNHYTSRLVRKARAGEKVDLHFWGIRELGAVYETHPDWKHTLCDILPFDPKGIRKLLISIKKLYGNLSIFITENGCCGPSDKNDDLRINFLKEYLEQVLLAIKDGVKVTGYAAWTLFDTFEWAAGYSIKFGFYQTDFNDTLRTRTPRKSAHYYANIIKSNLPLKYSYDEL